MTHGVVKRSRPAVVRLGEVIAACSVAGIVSACPLDAQIRDTVIVRERLEPVAENRLGVMLDRAIDRNSYRLGPGDRLNVSIFGDINRLHDVAVTPEGTVVIPALGVVRVLGLNLDEAEAQVEREVSRLYRQVRVGVTLLELRSFKVYVLGHVPQPGVRIATPVTRVSELLPDSVHVARRNISLRRTNGDTLSIDLLPFLMSGDVASNPTLHEGDVLFVPIVDLEVHARGAMFFPGTYEYRPGETLADFLALVHGGAPFSAYAADTVRVSRGRTRSERLVISLHRDAATGATGRAFLLEPFDAVFLPELADVKPLHIATVRGQVQRPGPYPIEPKVTTVRELVRLAGGLLPDASLANATLRRSAEPGLYDSLAIVSETGLSPDDRRIVQARALGAARYVVVDFERLFLEGRAEYDSPLENADLLMVPRRRDQVTVVGAVGRPGIVEFTPGRDVDHYVRLAGGFSKRADRRLMTVFRTRLGTEADPDDVRAIESGDEIVVPFRTPPTWIERVQFVANISSAVSAIVLTVFAMREFF